MKQDEFGTCKEFAEVSEFIEARESFTNSSEFVAAPDEFAYPGTTGTSDNREKKSVRNTMMYIAAVASVFLTAMAATNGFTEGNLWNVITDPVSPIISPTDTTGDVEGEPGDPSFRILYAKTDGTTLYYSYVAMLGERMTPVSVYSTAIDSEGNTATAPNDPDVWEGSRSQFEYAIDVSGLKGDLKLQLRGVFDKDGTEKEIIKTIDVDDMSKMPDTWAELTADDSSAEAMTIDYNGFIIFKEDDPRMTEYDFEVVTFNLEWYDADKNNIGGTGYVWDDNTVPEMSMLASSPGYIFSYHGPAHTDYAPNEAQYFSVKLVVEDKSTGKWYEVPAPEPLLISGAGPDVDVASLFEQYPDWYDSTTGDYLHFGASKGYRAHMIDSSVLFYRFNYTYEGGNRISISESYHKQDAIYTNTFDVFLINNDGQYTIDYEAPGEPSMTFAPTDTASYEGYSYMSEICDLGTVETLEALNSFDTMFEDLNARFDVSEISFMSNNHGKLIFYGKDAGKSWWPYYAAFTYSVKGDSDLSVDIMLDVEKFNTSANSTTSGQFTCYIEYYGELPMVVIQPFEPITQKTALQWLGDTSLPSQVTSRTVYVFKNGQGDMVNISADADPLEEARKLATKRFGNSWTNITQTDYEKFIEYRNPNSQTQNPNANNYHEEFFFEVT